MASDVFRGGGLREGFVVLLLKWRGLRKPRYLAAVAHDEFQGEVLLPAIIAAKVVRRPVAAVDCGLEVVNRRPLLQPITNQLPLFRLRGWDRERPGVMGAVVGEHGEDVVTPAVRFLLVQLRACPRGDYRGIIFSSLLW